MDWAHGFLRSLTRSSGPNSEFKIDPRAIDQIKALPEGCLKKVADAVVTEAKANAPVGKTGKLQKNLRAYRKARRGQVSFNVRTRTSSRMSSAQKAEKAWRKTQGLRAKKRRGYSVSVEFGHWLVRAGRRIRRIAARPFLRPARQRVAHNLGAVLRGVWK